MYVLEAEAFRSGLSGRLLEGQRFTTVGLAVDASALGLACLVTYVSVGEAMASVVWLFPLLALLAPGSREIYRRQHESSALETVRLTVAASSMAAVSLLAAIALVSAPPHPTGPIVRVWLVGSLVLALVRVGLLLARKRARVKGVAGQPALIVGAGRIGRIVERRLLDYPERGLVPVGFVDFEQSDTEAGVLGPAIRARADHRPNGCSARHRRLHVSPGGRADRTLRGLRAAPEYPSPRCRASPS